MRIFSGVRNRIRTSVHFRRAAGFCAGLCCGLLGTGGGILLVGAMRHRENADGAGQIRDPKSSYTCALFCMLPLSLISAFLSVRSGALAKLPLSYGLPYLCGAVPGGMLGAYLLDKIPAKAVRLIFVLLVLFGGARMAFR